MRLRSLGFVALAAAAVMQSCQPACTPPPPAPPPVETAPPPPPEITSLTISGQGNGHGRGMSAWGAFGWAVNGNAPWQDILEYYYRGTAFGRAGNEVVSVRLLGMDNAPVTGVISTVGAATLNGQGAWYTLHAHHVGGGRYDVWAASEAVCPGTPTATGVYLGQFTAPVFGTTVDQTSGRAEDVLGLCQPNGSVIHYRGTITARVDGAGNTRTVNHLLVENYLKGVMSRELPSSWGNAGGGRGMHALWAFAVAQRSFALSQNRYPGLAKTCDSSLCQVYGGAAYRANPWTPTSWPTVQVCESGNLTFECATTNRAVSDTAGLIRIWPSNGSVVSTEYSASHGPYSAGGPFPAVDDSMSNVPGNPLYTWSRTVDAATLEARYGLGNLVGAYSEPLPGSSWYGQWGNRVVLQGTAQTVVVSNLEFRNTFGFPSHGFTIAAVNY